MPEKAAKKEASDTARGVASVCTPKDWWAVDGNYCMGVNCRNIGSYISIPMVRFELMLIYILFIDVLVQ